MNYKDFAITLAKTAGKSIRQNFTLGIEKEWKADNSPVTITDKSINRMVIEEVNKNFPGHGVLGEEESSMVEGAEFIWVCDPIDGTVPFSHGVPLCVFSLALVKLGIPVLGVIYDAFLDRLFFAEKGKGAFLNGEQIQVNNNSFERSIVCWDSRTLSAVKAAHPSATLMTLYSICYEGIMVACGQFAATFFKGKGAHDVAALKVIVEEAGGKVTDRNGNEQRYDRQVNGALISNGVVHNELLKFSRQEIQN